MGNEETEIWKEIPGYEGVYKISESGLIYSYPRNGTNGGFFKGHVSRGYVGFKLSKDDCVKRFTIHKLVALVFLTKPDYYECINHIDGNKMNNHYTNLEYTTTKENNRHAWRIGLCEGVRVHMRNHMTGRKGKDNYSSKAILQLDIKTGDLIAEFVSATEASIVTGACRQHISKCCTGNRKSSGGFTWKHK